MKREPVDRVPIGSMIALPYWRQGLGISAHPARHMAAHALQWVEFQERIGFDPILFPYWFREASITDWPEAFFHWPMDATRDWRVRTEVVESQPEGIVLRRKFRTAMGEIAALVKTTPLQKWVLEHPIKEEPDIDHLACRPDPNKVETAGLEKVIADVQGRALVMLDVPGMFHEACEWRGAQRLVMDTFDRPEWVHKLLEMQTDYALRLVPRLASIGLPAMVIDESYAGLGISPRVFEKFVLPYDRRIADACRDAGILTSFHVCGRSSALLEMMADVGTDAIEPLVPVECAGNVNLADAKRRVGHRVTLMGGFNERLLAQGRVEDVRNETVKCLRAAASGGGYIMRTTGQLFEAKTENLRAFVDTAHESGRY